MAEAVYFFTSQHCPPHWNTWFLFCHLIFKVNILTHYLNIINVKPRATIMKLYLTLSLMTIIARSKLLWSVLVWVCDWTWILMCPNQTLVSLEEKKSKMFSHRRLCVICNMVFFCRFFWTVCVGLSWFNLVRLIQLRRLILFLIHNILRPVCCCSTLKTNLFLLRTTNIATKRQMKRTMAIGTKITA